MSEFNEVDNIIEEETPVLHLELEDGTEQDCAVIALFSVEELDDQEYIALITVEDLESDLKQIKNIIIKMKHNKRRRRGFTFISLQRRP